MSAHHGFFPANTTHDQDKGTTGAIKTSSWAEKMNLLIGYLKHNTEDTQNYKFWSSADTHICTRSAFPLFYVSAAGVKYNDKNKGWADAIVTVTVSSPLSHVAATQPLRDTTIIKKMKLQDQFTRPGLELRLHSRTKTPSRATVTTPGSRKRNCQKLSENRQKNPTKTITGILRKPGMEGLPGFQMDGLHNTEQLSAI